MSSAFGDQRERCRSADELQKYAGIAPVNERSGKKIWVHWRLQCPKFLRQTCVEWAAQTITRSFWAGAYYRQQRAKGSSHDIAVRAIAFKWTRVLYRCWQTRTPYTETVYLNALGQRGSPLLGKHGDSVKTGLALLSDWGKPRSGASGRRRSSRGAGGQRRNRRQAVVYRRARDDLRSEM
jgi:hypothetical protein